jgi:hypothetical protein
MCVEHKGVENLMSASNQVKIILTMGGSTSVPYLMEVHKTVFALHFCDSSMFQDLHVHDKN